jgi:hypothetical protein
MNTYEGYGTIENPCKSKRTISVQHCELIDGRFLTPQEIVNYVEKPSLNETHNVIIWDASEFSSKIIKQKNNYAILYTKNRRVSRWI